MSLNLWLAYVATVFVISGTPGPNMLLAMTHGIHYGLWRSLLTMAGLLAGLAVLFSISLGGLGAVLLASAYAFAILKYFGAAYLVYLGSKTWRSAQLNLSVEAQTEAADGWQRFRTGVLVSLSNPKAILFGVAFFPQFLNGEQSIAPQAIVLLFTFAVIETLWMLVYAGGGDKLSVWLKHGTRMRWFNRIAGAAFISAGVLLGTFSP